MSENTRAMLHDPTLIDTHTGLHRLDESRRCEVGLYTLDVPEMDPADNEQCPNFTRWQYDGNAVCRECMATMSSMNNDNEEAFAPALADDYVSSDSSFNHVPGM